MIGVWSREIDFAQFFSNTVAIHFRQLNIEQNGLGLDMDSQTDPFYSGTGAVKLSSRVFPIKIASSKDFVHYLQ